MLLKKTITINLNIMYAEKKDSQLFFSSWAKEFKSRKHKSLPIVVGSIIILSYLIYSSLSTRIRATGWEHFPITMLDWFAIIGSIGLFVLLIDKIISLISILQKKDGGTAGADVPSEL